MDSAIPNPSTYSIHVSTAKTWRGGENQVWLLTRGLLARGHRVLVVAPKNAPLLERCTASGVPVSSVHVHGELDLIGAMRLARLVGREQPDVVHAHDGHAVGPAKTAARWAGKTRPKLVLHRRTVFPLKGRWKYQGRVDRIVAISSAVRDRLQLDGIDAAAIRVVFSGLEFPDYEPAEGAKFRQSLNIPPDAFVLAHAAALTAEKRQSDILHAVSAALEMLKCANGMDVHLLIAGSGSLAEALQTEARQLGIEARVHFLGFVRDLRPLWAASSAAIFASDAEGLCTSLIEAQAAGLPAVITRAGGMVEVVNAAEPDRSGWIAEIGDVRGMAEAIARLVQENTRPRVRG